MSGTGTFGSDNFTFNLLNITNQLATVVGLLNGMASCSISGLPTFGENLKLSRRGMQVHDADYTVGRVAISSRVSHASACSRDSPHISVEGRKPVQKTGRSG